jgi:hypothetical protein
VVPDNRKPKIIKIKIGLAPKRKSQFAVGMAAPIFGDIGDGDDRGRALGDQSGPDFTSDQ